MTCVQCGGPFVSHSGDITTLVGFSSPPGHRHDDNCLRRVYVCAQGHATRLFLRRSCPACDWQGRPTCFCHVGQQLPAWPEGAISGIPALGLG